MAWHDGAMHGRGDQRGLTQAVQAVVLFPLALGVFLGLLQWSLHAWAHSTALAAAQEGAAVAAAFDGTADLGRTAAARVAANGSLSAVSVRVARSSAATEATVRGRVVTIVWARDVSATARVPTERVTGS